MRLPLLLLALLAAAAPAPAASATLSTRMVHRLSDEARLAAGPHGARWPRHGSGGYYRALVRSDLQRQKRKHQLLSVSEAGGIFSPGNDFGWLYYTWVDVGTPNTSFMVALDTGSDLFWVPCDCIECAPLAGYRETLDRDLGIYKPAESTTSRHLPCSHELCPPGSGCSSPKQPCPYSTDYLQENTTSSGLLIEDILHLDSRESHAPVKASVVIGCGRKQSGSYLDGIAPDGLLGLGMADISVPSFLARAGLVRNSFSMCFKEDSGRIFFGDQGVSIQQSTPFVPLYGKYQTYAVNVDKSCVGHKCFEATSFEALVDSGTSFTALPLNVYKAVAVEFDKQVHAPRITQEDASFEYCYSASPLKMPDVPTVALTFAANKSFQAVNPTIVLKDGEGSVAGFCLALQKSPEPIGIIGQNFLTGYHIVFDKENMKLGWYRSECHDPDNSTTVPLGPSQHNSPGVPLPSSEQQTSPTVTPPAVAGKAPTSSSGPPSNLHRLLANCCSLLLLTISTVFFIS
ncbi:aspartic proteinase-like protein 1 [Hordeum vulgare]|nr:aspartic proteinase-like protein 1 [Hordeum vulgare]